jgi:hypothetical protein
MSDEVAIKVENLSKAYCIGLQEQQRETLLDALAPFLRSPLENFRSVRKLSRFDELDHGPQPTDHGVHFSRPLVPWSCCQWSRGLWSLPLPPPTACLLSRLSVANSKNP